jgi:hypothetical protein
VAVRAGEGRAGELTQSHVLPLPAGSAYAARIQSDMHDMR